MFGVVWTYKALALAASAACLAVPVSAQQTKQLPKPPPKSPAVSAPSAQATPVVANVISGRRSRIYRLIDMNPDCSPTELPVVRITREPQHGKAEIVVEEGYSNYAKDDQQAPCNLKKREIVVVYYTSLERYLGRDDVSIDYFITSWGGYGAVNFTINVR